MKGCGPGARAWKALQAALGISSGLATLAAAVWLLVVYVQACRTEPVEKALVESLKEKAKTDGKVQEVLQPLLDRRHEALVARWKAYDRGGAGLLVAGAVFLAWIKWLRPVRPRRTEPPAILQKERAPAPPGKPHPCICAKGSAGAAGELDLRFVEEIVSKEGRKPEAAIPILQAIQSHYRYLPLPALRRLSELTEISPAQIAGVATFYGQFRHGPVGDHIVRVCEGTACHVAGAVEVGIEIRRRLGMASDSDTDPSRKFTVERVACLGSCSLAPVVTIDEKIYGHVSALGAGGLIQEFLEAEVGRGSDGLRRRNGTRSGGASKARLQAPVEIRIGLGSCGVASGGQAVRAALEEEVIRSGGGAAIKAVGCAGLCHREPLVEVVEEGRSALYGNVRPEDVRKLVEKHLRPRGLLGKARRGIAQARLRLLDDGAWRPVEERMFDAAPYLQKQVRVVLENCGEIDPLSLEEYRGRGGFQALQECLRKLSSEDVIDRVRASGLRGRGGAGFPAAVKWDVARLAPASKRYVIANGDEGDPGAFMDRAVLEADPFRVIEGLAIAAYAIGSDEGFIYVRREYPIAVRHVRAALEKAEAAGLLGESILGTPFRLRIHVREGAGAFVCGEETALIRSIEGFRGMPRLRPPFPAREGLWGRPTVINNVETLACLPWIIRRGPEAFASLGTERSKGTKVFSLAGKVDRGGLIEVPMGITIREIVEEIGGGVKRGRRFKAVLIGGPSGGCIPARLADTRIDFEELTRTGAIMGSGGLVVLDDRDCAVEISRYFLHFTQNESCGKCTYCRVGTKRMLEILERICAGKGRKGDLEILEELADRVKRGSLCGLGQTAPNPVLTTLRYFREEYQAHIEERRCPAAQCKPLIHYTVTDSCTGCTLCAQACPAGAIERRPYQKHEVLDDRCTRCGMCVTACPEDSIEVA